MYLPEQREDASVVSFVFLHGDGQGSWVWDDTIAAIRRQSGGGDQCLALDAPGCGRKRGCDTTAYDFTDITRELVRDIEDAGLSGVVLVGHSQAGTTLPQMAELAPPGLISRLIYVSCVAPLSGLNTLEQTGRGPRGSNVDEVGNPVAGDAPMEERYRTMFCNDMSDDEAAAFLGKLGKDGWPSCSYTYTDWRYDHLRTIPSSYVLLLRDLALPAEWQERFVDRLHARRITRIDAGHQVMNTRPESLAEVLRQEACG